MNKWAVRVAWFLGLAYITLTDLTDHTIYIVVSQITAVRTPVTGETHPKAKAIVQTSGGQSYAVQEDPVTITQMIDRTN